MRGLVPFLLLLLLPASALAQPPYLLQHFSNENGLPSNAIKGMEWEPGSRLLWIGTEAGLVHWDGQHFHPAGLHEGRVWEMGRWPGPSGPLYALCDNRAIYSIRSGTARFERRSQSPILAHSLAITDSADVFPLVGSQPGEPLFSDWIFALGSEEFLVLLNRRLYRKSPSGVQLLLAALDEVRFVNCDAGILVTARQGVWRFDPAEKRAVPLRVSGLAPGLAVQFVPGSPGDMPMAYQQGRLFTLQPQPGALEARLLFDGLPPSCHPLSVRNIPGTGLIVLADKIDGLYLLRPQSVRLLTDSSSQVPGNRLVTYGQALLPDGRVVNHSGVLFDRHRALPGPGLPVSGSPHLVRFGDHLYFPHANRLFRYNVFTRKTDTLPALDGSNWAILAQTRGSLYVLGGFTVYRVEDTVLRPVFSFPAQPRQGEFLQNTDAIEWAPGVLALASGNEVRFLDLDRSRLTRVRVSQKAPVRFLRRVGKDLLICTYGEGLFLYRGNRVLALPGDKAGHLNFSHAVVPDGHGRCYISSNNGLFAVSEAALLASAGSTTPVYYHYLGQEDGLRRTELNGGCQPAFLELPDETLSFPSMNGLAQLHPDSVHLPEPSGVILLSVLADGAAIEETGGPHLPATLKFMRIRAILPHWGPSGNLYGWYRLRRSGEPHADTNWIAFDPARQEAFDFTSLKTGSYLFEVRTFSGFGPGSLHSRGFSFHIDPPWYAQLPFLLLWTAIACLCTWAAIHWRTRRLERTRLDLERKVHSRTLEVQQKNNQLEQQLHLLTEANELKERLIAVISHNIITPLRYIHRATSMMRQNARHMDPELREKAVDSINDTSLELELLSVNLLNWIKLQHQQVRVAPEDFAIADVVAQVKRLLDPIALERAQQIVLDGFCPEPTRQYKDALQVIAYNLALNALLHAGGSGVHLSCHYNEGWFELLVCDDGKGLPPELKARLNRPLPELSALKETDNQGKGFGFLLIKDLLRLMKGSLHAQSEPGQGTCISVRFFNLDLPKDPEYR